MASRAQHPRLTAEDFDALLAEHGWSLDAELIDGEAVVIPPDGPVAALVQGELHVALRQWQATTGDGGLVLQSVFVKLDATSRLGPDVAWWAAERRRSALPVGQMDTVPDWVAEVLSPSTRENDLGPKRELYLRAGVRELWLVDPAARNVIVVHADGTERIVGDDVVSDVLPGFGVATSTLFAAI